MFAKVLVAGLGMIGGSVAMDMRKLKLCEQLDAFDTNPHSLASALTSGLVDHAAERIEDLPGGYDLLVVATPVSVAATVVTRLSPMLATDAIVMDVGSCKRHFLEQMHGQQALRVVAAHPLSGLEYSDLAAARTGLFAGKRVVLSPIQSTDTEASSSVARLWRRLGAQVLFMSPEWHDEILAKTSHLPHLLSFALYDALNSELPSTALAYFSGGGLRDFTRIAASNATMWADIFVHNKDKLLEDLGKTQQLLAEYRRLISESNYDELHAKLKAVRSARAWLNDQARLDMRSEPVQKLHGVCQVPGDKSISHRALLFAALAEGESRVNNLLEGEDNLATLAALAAMGVRIVFTGRGQLQVTGLGLRGLRAPEDTLELGNSGTAARLFCGLLAAQSFSSTISGDESLNSRPMARVLQPLQLMGARFTARDGDLLPATILPADGQLRAIDYEMNIPSAQVKSALVIAALYADGVSTITECGVTRDHTERMLQSFGHKLKRDGALLSVTPAVRLKACELQVPGDISSATFLLVAASICADAEVLIRSVGVNPTRDGALRILQAMGADITLENSRNYGAEPVADIRVRSSTLRAISVPPEWVPLAIDEFPVLFIAAACAQGDFELRGARELKVKESDRLGGMVRGLRRLGVKVEQLEDGVIISGNGGSKLPGGAVDCLGDHRLAMAFAVAACAAQDAIVISNVANVRTSFPNFTELLNGLGARLSVNPICP